MSSKWWKSFSFNQFSSTHSCWHLDTKNSHENVVHLLYEPLEEPCIRQHFELRHWEIKGGGLRLVYPFEWGNYILWIYICSHLETLRTADLSSTRWEEQILAHNWTGVDCTTWGMVISPAVGWVHSAIPLASPNNVEYSSCRWIRWGVSRSFVCSANVSKKCVNFEHGIEEPFAEDTHLALLVCSLGCITRGSTRSCSSNLPFNSSVVDHP